MSSVSNSVAFLVRIASPKFALVITDKMSSNTSSASFAPLSLPNVIGSKYGWRAFSSEVYVSDWYLRLSTVILRDCISPLSNLYVPSKSLLALVASGIYGISISLLPSSGTLRSTVENSPSGMSLCLNSSIADFKISERLNAAGIEFT